MKKTLVIHPNDITTDFLCAIYSDKNWPVINTYTPKKQLRKLIRKHDRIVMLGHGDPRGLYGFGNFVIDSSFVDLLRKKTVVCIWCFSDKFVEEHGLKGFYTGMIISEPAEAEFFSVDHFGDEIDRSNALLGDAVRRFIDSDDMLGNVQAHYPFNVSKVTEYNHPNLYYRAA